MKHNAQSFLARVIIATFTVVIISILLPTAIVARMNVRQQIDNDQKAILESFSTVQTSISTLLDDSSTAFRSILQRQDIDYYIGSYFDNNLEQVQAKQNFDSEMRDFFHLYGHITDVLFVDANGSVSGSSLDWHYTGGAGTDNVLLEAAYHAAHSAFSTYWFDAVPAASLLPEYVQNITIGDLKRSGYRICGTTRLLGSAINRNIAAIIAINEKDIRQRYSYLANAGSEVYIVHSDGKCFSSTNPDCITTSMPWYSAIPEEQSGSFRYEEQSGNYQYFYQRFPFSEWTIVKRVPLSVYSSSSTQLYKAALLVSVLVLMFITPILVIWIRKICQPLRRLTDTMIAVRDGNLDTRIESGDRDPSEVRIVAQQANEMLDSLTDLLVRNEENEEHKHRLEMQTLQSQITPHFMFNTLSSIRWMAQMSGCENVSHMLQLFSQLLHPIYSDWAEKWTLQEELSFTQNYIELVHIRYAGKVHISTEVPGLPVDRLVPRFLLQPVLENSCEHAVRADRDLNVSITIEDRHDALLIHVVDDGIGIDPESLEKLRSILDSDTEPQRLKNGHRSIGLYNIHKRLKLMYGNTYGVRVYSMHDVGTTIDIIIGR